MSLARSPPHRTCLRPRIARVCAPALRVFVRGLRRARCGVERSLHPMRYRALNPKPSTVNPKPSTLNPQPSTPMRHRACFVSDFVSPLCRICSTFRLSCVLNRALMLYFTALLLLRGRACSSFRLSCVYLLAHTHTHSLSLTHTHTHSLSHTHTHSHSLSLSLTCAHALTLSHTCTHIPTCSRELPIDYITGL